MLRKIRIARRNDIVIPWRAYWASRRRRIPFAFTCALLEKESFGGENVFGHDSMRCGDQVHGRAVTKDRYRRYKARRAECGMQGVGPAQLTWWEYQDEADKRGGCWRPYINVLTGLGIIRDAVKRGLPLREAARVYNGSGPDAEAYADDLMARMLVWRDRFDPPKAA